MAISEARCRGFSPDTPVPSPPPSIEGFSQLKKTEKKCCSHSVKSKGGAVLSEDVVHIVSVRRTRCVARKEHTNTP